MMLRMNAMNSILLNIVMYLSYWSGDTDQVKPL